MRPLQHHGTYRITCSIILNAFLSQLKLHKACFVQAINHFRFLISLPSVNIIKIMFVRFSGGNWAPYTEAVPNHFRFGVGIVLQLAVVCTNIQRNIERQTEIRRQRPNPILCFKNMHISNSLMTLFHWFWAIITHANCQNDIQIRWATIT